MEQGINYIKKRLQEGASEEVIKKSLADGGWSAHHIETAFQQAKPAVSQNKPWTNMPTPQNLTNPSSSLPGFISILKDALSVYKSKVATLTAILIPIVVVFAFSIFLPSAISNLFANNAIAGMVIFAVVMLNMLLLILACVSTSVAYIYVLSSNEKVSARQAFRKSFSRDFFAICWLSFLAALIIGGGYGLFIIPGVIFMVWFFSASYVFFNENVRGMNAMLKSKEYVRGMWWPVFLRMLPIILISLLFSFLSQYAVNQLPAGNIWVVTGVSLLSSAISALVITPILLSYYLVLYNKIREKKGDVSFVPSAGKKALFILLGIAGIAVGSYLFITSAPYIAKTLIKFQSSNVRLEEYTAPDKSFSVLMPANSTAQDDVVLGVVNQGLNLVAGFRKYPSTGENGNQDTDLLNFTKGFSPKLTYLSNYRAVDYGGASSGVYVKGRAIIVGDRLYVLKMIYKDSSYYNETIYNQFINSFKVLSQNNSTSQPIPSDWKPFYHITYGYQISHPPEWVWEEDREEGNGISTFYPYEGSYDYLYIKATDLLPEEYISQLQKSAGGEVTVGKVEEVSLSGLVAYKIFSSSEAAGGDQYVLRLKNKTIIIGQNFDYVGGSTQQQHAQLLGIFNQVINTFKVTR